VGRDPDADFQIGVTHGVVGCGTKLVTMGLEWFTIVGDKIVYHGPITSVADSNPWAISGRPWYTYKVSHHFVLGNLDVVLTDAGVSPMVLPRTQNRFVKDYEILKLVAYARRRMGDLASPYAEIIAPASACASPSPIVIASAAAFACSIDETTKKEIRPIVGWRLEGYDDM
jgi:hypothetical protein